MLSFFKQCLRNKLMLLVQLLADSAVHHYNDQSLLSIIKSLYGHHGLKGKRWITLIPRRISPASELRNGATEENKMV